MPDWGLGGWFGRQATIFFFDLPIFWPKNSLETPQKPLSHSIRTIQQVSHFKTDKGSNDSDLSICTVPFWSIQQAMLRVTCLLKF